MYIVVHRQILKVVDNIDRSGQRSQIVWIDTWSSMRGDWKWQFLGRCWKWQTLCSCDKAITWIFICKVFSISIPISNNMMPQVSRVTYRTLPPAGVWQFIWQHFTDQKVYHVKSIWRATGYDIAIFYRTHVNLGSDLWVRMSVRHWVSHVFET